MNQILFAEFLTEEEDQDESLFDIVASVMIRGRFRDLNHDAKYSTN